MTNTKKVSIGLGIGIFFIPYIFSWFTLRQGYTKKARILSLGWFGFCFIVFALPSFNNSLNRQNEKKQQLEKLEKELKKLREIAPPNEQLTSEETIKILKKKKLPELATIPLKLFKNDDLRSPIKDTKSRIMLINEGVDDTRLRTALQDYYQLMKEDLRTSRNETRHVFIFAFPTKTRAEAGLGQWRGMVKEIALNGEPLSDQPEITIKTPSSDVETPTVRENKIYDETMKALFDNPDQKESRIMKKVARKNKMSVRSLEELFIKVSAYRN